MNLLQHGIGDEEHDNPIVVDDALEADPGDRCEMVVTNPPFGAGMSSSLGGAAPDSLRDIDAS